MESLKDLAEKVILSPLCTNPEHKKVHYAYVCLKKECKDYMKPIFMKDSLKHPHQL